METLIIYDDIGKIFTMMSGDVATPSGGINFLKIVIPEGKMITGVDVSVTPNVAILEDIPISELTQIRGRVESVETEVVNIHEVMEAVFGGVTNG